MNVNGVTNVNDAYSQYKTSENTKAASEANLGVIKSTSTEADVKFDEEGVVYEPTLEVPTKTYKTNDAMINKLKADAENRMNQLQNIVSKLISQQSNAFADANDLWSVLRSGKLEVDPETQAQAKADIAEDGYYGVKQTSDRIIDFANALTGGDPSKIEKMRDAFKKGYEQAEKTWGGELPEICKQTYDAVMEKFDKLAEEAGLTSQN